MIVHDVLYGVLLHHKRHPQFLLIHQTLHAVFVCCLSTHTHTRTHAHTHTDTDTDIDRQTQTHMKMYIKFCVLQTYLVTNLPVKINEVHNENTTIEKEAYGVQV